MMKKKYILKSLLLLSFLVVGTNALGQTTKKRPDTAVSNTYECGIPIIAPQQCDRVQNKGNAIDTDDTTFAKLTANAGLLVGRSEEHTSELQSRPHLVCRLLLEKKKKIQYESNRL